MKQTEVRHGRNFIRAGDIVKFQERPGAQYQRATFMHADEDKVGLYYEVRSHRSGNIRSLRPSRIHRIQGATVANGRGARNA